MDNFQGNDQNNQGTGQSYDQQYNQGAGQSYDQQYNQGAGSSYDQQYNQGAGQSYDQQYSQNGGQNFNQQYNQGVGQPYDQRYVPNNGPAYNKPQSVYIPAEYQPISMWGYLGYQLLFAIPCVGFILLLVFSFGGTSNVNVKNFARSHFCLFIISIILTVLLFLLGGAAGLFGIMMGL